MTRIQQPTIVSISSKLLTYDAKTKTLSAEHSSLGSPHLGGSVSVRSATSGTVEVFVFERHVKDRERELLAWEYRNAKHGIKLVIFND